MASDTTQLEAGYLPDGGGKARLLTLADLDGRTKTGLIYVIIVYLGARLKRGACGFR